MLIDVSKIVFLILMICMSVQDVKSLEIDLSLSASCLFLKLWTVYLLVIMGQQGRLVQELLAGFLFFLAFLLSAYFFGTGGADALCAGLIGIFFGMTGAAAILAGLFLAVPAALRGKPFPLIPYLTFGSILVFFFQIL